MGMPGLRAGPSLMLFLKINTNKSKWSSLFQPMIIEIQLFKRDYVRWAARGGEFCLK